MIKLIQSFHLNEKFAGNSPNTVEIQYNKRKVYAPWLSSKAAYAEQRYR